MVRIAKLRLITFSLVGIVEKQCERREELSVQVMEAMVCAEKTPNVNEGRQRDIWDNIVDTLFYTLNQGWWYGIYYMHR